MGDLRGEVKRMGLVPDQRLNHWKRGVPQNPDTWAYKIYHYHLTHPPCSMRELCRGIGASPNRHSQKVTMIINQLRKAKTWQWPTHGERNQAAKDVLTAIGSCYGEDV